VGADDETESVRTALDSPRPKEKRAKSDPAFTRGTLIGRYIVVEQLGEGGMGVVYSAFDPELNRKIALKLVTSGDQQRMLREAQALARLSHPNVVAIHDVGTAQERVFLAMELVEGDTLSAWLKAKPRTWREIVAMFRDAGRGLAAAHAAGIVHRDFKPGNVLVGQDGRVRVLDFGLARAADEAPELEPFARSSSRDLLGEDLTVTGSLMGTPVYMPPEAFRGEVVGEPGDQYSFCVALYEALYKERPFDRNWLDPKDPPELKPPPANTSVPAWLRRVVVRGIERDITARYPSMNALLTALEADPARARRRVAMIVAAVVGISGLVVGTAILSRSSTAVAPGDPCAVAAPLAGTWGLPARVRMRAAFVAAGGTAVDAEFARAATALDDIAKRWSDARAQACADTRERHIKPEASLLLRLACFDRQQESLDGLVTLLERPDRLTVKQAARAVRRLHGPVECTNARATFVEPPAPPIAPKVTELRKRLSQAQALRFAARTKEAIAQLMPLATEARQLGYAPLIAEVLLDLAQARMNAGDNDVEALLVEAERAAVASRADTLAARSVAAQYRAANLNGKDPATSRDLENRARDWVEREGDLEAQAMFANADGVAVVQRGDYEAAIKKYDRAIELDIELMGSDSAEVLQLQQDRGLLLAMLGRYEEAAASQKAANDEMEHLYGDDSDDLSGGFDNYGTTLVWLGRYDEAWAVLQRADQMKSVSDSNRGPVRCDLARVLIAQGKFDAAIASCQDGLAKLRASGNDGTNLAINEDPLAAGYLGAGRFNEALAQTRQCLADFRKVRDADGVDMVACYTLEGTALLELGRSLEARTELERALKLQSGHPAGPGVTANLDYQLARALVATNVDRVDRARARELVTKAHDELAKLPFKKPLLDEVDVWQAKHAADLR
jgi:tetratricopeptide (TPR) repeat protein